MSAENLIPLSASRIKTLETCSWIYWCKYVLKMPDTSNDGASRGTVCHLVFELLGEPRHKKHYNSIIKRGKLKDSPAVYRLVNYHAKKLDVADDENMELIEDMILNGLNYDFFGKDKGPLSLAISEKDFSISVDEQGKKYKIRGFIDKLFLYKDKTAIIRDFKTSKQVFKGKEVSDNLQDLMYSLAVKKMYPDYNERQSEFLFLKFNLEEDLLGNPGKGVLKMNPISDEELEGLEYQLTEVQNTIENFDVNLAKSSLAAKKPYPKDGTFGGPLACGKKGFKKSRGEYLLDKQGNKIPAFICAFREPKEYYVLVNKDNKIIKSSFDKEDLLGEEGKIEKKFYEGCPHWNNKDIMDDLLGI